MLNRIANDINGAATWFVDKFHDTKSAVLFIKVLQGYTLLKVILAWTQASVLLGWTDKAVYVSVFVKVVLAPINLGAIDLNVFFAVFTVVLIVCLWQRPVYWLNALFFWFVASLFILRYPTINGSDLVLTALSLWSVALQTEPVSGREQIKIIQTGVFNFALVLLRFQIIVVYLLSGWDKLLSPEWRSGEVFTYIRRSEVRLNPAFVDLLQSDWINFTVSWATILFEIGFGILVMNQRTRLWALCAGVIFHMLIWWMLSLPDFALIMIVSYIIFLSDSDRLKIRQLFIRQPL